MHQEIDEGLLPLGLKYDVRAKLLAVQAPRREIWQCHASEFDARSALRHLCQLLSGPLQTIHDTHRALPRRTTETLTGRGARCSHQKMSPIQHQRCDWPAVFSRPRGLRL